MTTDSFKPKSRLTVIFAILVFAFGMAPATALHMAQWTLGPDGLTEGSHRLPYWDFSNLWAGTRIALDGHVEALFDCCQHHLVHGPLRSGEPAVGGISPGDVRRVAVELGSGIDEETA